MRTYLVLVIASFLLSGCDSSLVNFGDATPTANPSITITGYNGQTVYTSQIDLTAELIDVDPVENSVLWTTYPETTVFGMTNLTKTIYNPGPGTVTVSAALSNGLSDMVDIDFENYLLVTTNPAYWTNEAETIEYQFFAGGTGTFWQKTGNVWIDMTHSTIPIRWSSDATTLTITKPVNGEWVTDSYPYSMVVSAGMMYFSYYLVLHSQQFDYKSD